MENESDQILVSGAEGYDGPPAIHDDILYDREFI